MLNIFLMTLSSLHHVINIATFETLIFENTDSLDLNYSIKELS